MRIVQPYGQRRMSICEDPAKQRTTFNADVFKIPTIVNHKEWNCPIEIQTIEIQGWNCQTADYI